MPNKPTKTINVFSMDLQSASPKLLTSGTVDKNAVCSPDSTYFLFTKLDNGKQLLMRMPLAGGEAKQIYPGIIQFATISPDGKTVAVAALEGTGINAKLAFQLIGPDGGTPTATIHPNPFISGPLTFSADGQSLYYPITEHGVSNIVRQPLSGGDSVLVTDFKNLLIYGYSYDWANQKLAVTRGHTSSDAVMIKDQRAE
jgi:hypothetical protein